MGEVRGFLALHRLDEQRLTLGAQRGGVDRQQPTVRACPGKPQEASLNAGARHRPSPTRRVFVTASRGPGCA
jgi:hypothetical protein